jgi:hypothetical protein
MDPQMAQIGEFEDPKKIVVLGEVGDIANCGSFIAVSFRNTRKQNAELIVMNPHFGKAHYSTSPIRKELITMLLGQLRILSRRQTKFQSGDRFFLEPSLSGYKFQAISQVAYVVEDVGPHIQTQQLPSIGGIVTSVQYSAIEELAKS